MYLGVLGAGVGVRVPACGERGCVGVGVCVGGGGWGVGRNIIERGGEGTVRRWER